MPEPAILPPISHFQQGDVDNKDPKGVFEAEGLCTLPKIYPEDRKIPEPHKYFNFPPGSRYSYLRLLGHGAYGYVCAAMDLEEGMPVAIKRINQINNDLVARRTLRELRLLRHFQGHPNITNIRDILMPASANFDELYVSQELMDADLCHAIQPRFPMTEEHVRLFIFQILCGLKALHSANVIHRDLKPGNLLWKHTGDLKICDFGLARGINEQIVSMDTLMTAYVATRWYRPPEIMLYQSRYGKPLDVWSVGCIFAELLGRRIFLPGQTSIEQLSLILQKLGTPTVEEMRMIPSEKARMYLQKLPFYPKRSLASRFPDASPDAIDLLERMLQFEPSHRITVNDALQHPFLVKLTQRAPKEQLADFCPFDFSFDVRCKTLSDLKSAILDEVKIYHTMATSGLPVRLASMQLFEKVDKSHERDDERVVDGLLARHINTYYSKRNPFNAQ